MCLHNTVGDVDQVHGFVDRHQETDWDSRLQERDALRAEVTHTAAFTAGPAARCSWSSR